jgi:hypothetical protein
MSSSNGGKRRRGRPVTLTPEQRLERERERWHLKKVRQRKAAGDADWQRRTPSGYFVQLHVLQYTHLAEALVGYGFLRKNDAEIPQRVDAAVDRWFESATFDFGYLDRVRKVGAASPRTVRVRMTQDLADKLVAYEYQVWSERKDYAPRKDWEQFSSLLTRANAANLRATEHRIGGRHTEAAKATAKYIRLQRQADAHLSQPVNEPPKEPPAWFVENIRANKPALVRAAETCLHRFYMSYDFVPDPPTHPCNCKLALPACECLSRFKVEPGGGVLEGPPKPKRPKAGKVLAKRDLYSGPKPRWWRNPRHDDDPVIRSHDKSAGVGMKGFYAGGRGVWKNDKAIYYLEQDNRASTRDWNRTAREGEKGLQKPYDDPTGTPKSWSNPSDVAPDSEDTIIRLGNRVIEEGKIEPPTDKD